MTSAEQRGRNHWFPRVLLLVILLTTATHAMRPMVSYRALELGAGALDLGIIASSFALLSLFVAVPLGSRIDRWGESRFLVAGATITAVTSLSLIWIGTIWALALSQAALGLGHIMSVIGTQTLVANGGDPRGRDGRFNLYTVIVSLGQLTGPAVAGLLAGGAVGGSVQRASTASTGRVFSAAFVLTTLAVLVALTLWFRPHRRRPSRSTHAVEPVRETSLVAVRRVLRIPSMPHAMLASLTVLTSIDILTTYLPAYGEANGLSVQTVGFLLAARAGASMVSRLVMLPLMALLGRRWLLMLSMALPAAALAVFPIVDGLVLLYVAMVVIGLGLGLGQPLTLSWVAGRAPRNTRGTALAVRLSGNRLGQAVLPAAVGGLTGATGLMTVFVSLAVMLGLSTTVVFGASFGTGEPEEG